MVFQSSAYYSHFGKRRPIRATAHLVAPKAQEILEDHTDYSDFLNHMAFTRRHYRISKSAEGKLS